MLLAKSADGSTDQDGQILSAHELIADPLFAGVPPKFLLWQQGLALRRRLRKGDMLCREGDPGNTAYLIKSGRLAITISGKSAVRIERGPEDLIVGEMACLSGKPRTAAVSALQDSEVWEIRRNVLDRLMRTPSQRQRFETIFRERSLDVVLRESEVFSQLDPGFLQCTELLRPRLSFVHVNPGQTIFRQDDRADHVYLIRLGHIKVVVQTPDRNPNILYRGPGTMIGEIGLLALSPDDIGKSPDQINSEMGAAFASTNGPLTSVWPASQRTATCSTLDHVEMARIKRADFLEMVKQFHVLRRQIIEMSLKRLIGDRNAAPAMRQYVEQGLYQGQSLLVLDLNKCTRCDECTRACVQQHGRESHGLPITRMLREGLRFGDNLVATSCRSCKDAYCMIGCPVDAIHRGKHQQIVIENHCIGCGLCASDCPFGNIWMIENVGRTIERPLGDESGTMQHVAQPKAATCDLCDADGKMNKPIPRCVHACPHDAAHRMTGEELLKDVMSKMS